MKKRIMCIMLALLCVFSTISTASAALDVSRLRGPNRFLRTEHLDFNRYKGEYYKCARTKISGSDLRIDVRLENLSEDYTVDAVDIAIYCTNAYDEPIYPDDCYDGYIRYFTADVKIKPGKNAFIGYSRMEGCRNAKNFYVAITRFHCDDDITVDCGGTDTDPLEKYNWLCFEQ